MNETEILKAMNRIDGQYLDVRAGIKQHPAKWYRRPAAIAAAVCAAAAMTVTAGAVYNVFFHKESVEHYISASDSLPETPCLTAENSHIRLTVDKILYDGCVPTLIITAEALDEQGLRLIAETPIIYFSSRQQPDPVTLGLAGGGEMFRDDQEDEKIYKYICELDSEDLLNSGLDKPVFLHFSFSGEHRVKLNEKGGVDTSEMLSAEVRFEKNLETAEYISSDGRCITMSPIAAQLGSGFTLEEGENDLLMDMQLKYSDGSIGPLPHSKTTTDHLNYEITEGVASVGYERLFYGRVLDISDVTAVIVKGQEFTRK